MMCKSILVLCIITVFVPLVNLQETAGPSPKREGEICNFEDKAKCIKSVDDNECPDDFDSTEAEGQVCEEGYRCCQADDSDDAEAQSEPMLEGQLCNPDRDGRCQPFCKHTDGKQPETQKCVDGLACCRPMGDVPLPSGDAGGGTAEPEWDRSKPRRG